MTAIRWLETDTLSNQNISSALAIGAYTAAADRLIMAQAFVDQAAGNGDYIMYATLQIGGAGSIYVILPKTTMAAASGETAIAGQSGWINVRNGDIVTVYVDGLAGDTTTPDTIVRWFEDAALQPTTADTTLDIAATGEAGLDFNNIKAATAPTTLTNITVPVTTTLTNAPTDMATATNQTTILNRIGAFTGAGLNTILGFLRALGAKAAALTPTDLSAGTTYDNTTDSQEAIRDNLPAAAPTANAIADQVWDELIAGHAGAGSTGEALTNAAAAGGATPASLWAYASRTLTQSAAQVADIVSGSSITIQRGDTLSAALTGLGAITGYTTLDFTVKYNKADADTSAIIRIRKNASGLNDGLIRLNGAAAATAADGSITLDSQPLGNITINLIAADTDDLIPGQGYYYDVQMITGTTVLTMTTGTFNVAADVTRLVV